jgi:hypothetical protein
MAQGLSFPETGNRRRNLSNVAGNELRQRSIMSGCFGNRHSKILTNIEFFVKPKIADFSHLEPVETSATERIRLKITTLSNLFPQLRQRAMGIPPSFVKSVTSSIIPWHFGQVIVSS